MTKNKSKPDNHLIKLPERWLADVWTLKLLEVIDTEFAKKVLKYLQ